MDRLTERIGDRIQIKGCETLYGPERKGAYLNNAVVRLSEYEATMLTPDEIMGLCDMDRRARMADLLREEEKKILSIAGVDEKRESTRVIAIDFDGCLCEDKFPEIGKPNWDVIHEANREQVNGASLILWTCRRGALLTDAIKACEGWELSFDAINENIPERIALYGGDTRKICADEYWDDKSVLKPEPDNNPMAIEELREMKGEPVWIERTNKKSRWALIRYSNVNYLVTNGCDWLKFEEYQKTWAAYRSKPKEEK